MNTVGTNIRKRREELGLTQEELAEKLNYKSKSTINKIEMGINDITQSKVAAFAKALDTTPAFLMGWAELWSEESAELDAEMTLDMEYKELFLNWKMLNKEGRKLVLDYAAALTKAYQKED